MTYLFAQGDLLIEQVPDVGPSGRRIAPRSDGVMIVAEGEHTGHSHRFHDAVVMFRDDALAWDVPSALYVGHVRVDVDAAKLLHEEHAPVTLPRGTWRIRRQRELEPNDVRYIAD